MLIQAWPEHGGRGRARQAAKQIEIAALRPNLPIGDSCGLSCAIGGIMNALDLNWETHSGPIELLVALAIGLMVGMEREWRGGHDERLSEEHAGLRTFGLLGLLGGLAGLLQPNSGGWVLAGLLLAVAALMIA